MTRQRYALAAAASIEHMAAADAFIRITPTTRALNADGKMHLYLQDLSADDEWIDREVLSLRFDPVNASGADFAVDYILAGAAEDFDRDGLDDAGEGFGDPDADGLPNLADTDSDGDGFDDDVEVEADKDPYDAESFPGDDNRVGTWTLYRQ